MSRPRGLRCPCGAPAPDDLPTPGREPVTCPSCHAPLVAPGRVAMGLVERGLGAALLTGVACAGAWMLLAKLSSTGAAWVVILGGVLVGVATRAAARARGLRIQGAAALGFVVFLLLGEVLLYRAALLPRLIAMHRAEGARDPQIRAQRELDNFTTFGDRLEHYLHIEATLALFVAVTVGVAVLLLVTRAPPAVAAFGQADDEPDGADDDAEPGPPEDDEPPAGDEGDEPPDDGPAPRPSVRPMGDDGFDYGREPSEELEFAPEPSDEFELPPREDDDDGR